MDGRCIGCRWWKPDNDLGEGWGECELTHARGIDPIYPETIAIASDWSAREAILQTHETFGCVQFAASDA